MGNQPHAWTVHPGSGGLLAAVPLAGGGELLPLAGPQGSPGGFPAFLGGSAGILAGGGADRALIYCGTSRLLGAYGLGPLGGGASYAVKDQAVVFSGDAALQYVFGAGGGAADWQGISTNDPTKGFQCVPLKPGVAYRLQLSFRTDSIAGAPSIRITAQHNALGTLLSQKTFTITAANAWQTEQFIFLVPAGAEPNSGLLIEFQRGQTAQQLFWVDSLRPDEIGQRFRCKAFPSGVQSILNNTATTLAFDSEAYDVGSLHDTVTNNSRITIPKGGDAGLWMFVAQIDWDPNVTAQRQASILKNNVTLVGSVISAAVQGGFGTRHQVTYVEDSPAVGDFFEVRVIQNSGGALNVNGGVTGTWFAASHAW